jgi:hypothetical protein
MGDVVGHLKCPCGADRWTPKRAPTVALVMQLSTVGELPRRRAKAITIRCCNRCIAQIHTKDGRELRRALAAALQEQWIKLKHGKEAPRAPRAARLPL